MCICVNASIYPSVTWAFGFWILELEIALGALLGCIFMIPRPGLDHGDGVWINLIELFRSVNFAKFRFLSLHVYMFLLPRALSESDSCLFVQLA